MAIVVTKIAAGISVTAYSAPYPIQLGNLSAMPEGCSNGSLPTGGRAWFGRQPGTSFSLSDMFSISEPAEAARRSCSRNVTVKVTNCSQSAPLEHPPWDTIARVLIFTKLLCSLWLMRSKCASRKRVRANDLTFCAQSNARCYFAHLMGLVP